MEMSISETLAKIRKEHCQPRPRQEPQYTASGNPIQGYREPVGHRQPIYAPSELYERQEKRFSHEDNFDPS